MINLQFNIRNPFSDRFSNSWTRLFDTPFAHKFLELQVYRSSDILDVFVRFTTRQDHAGLHAGIGLLSWNFEFNWYDSRHWNRKNNRWENYDFA